MALPSLQSKTKKNMSYKYHKKYSNYRSCAVLECRNTTISAPGKLWIGVPTEINMRNIWLIRAKRDPATMSTKTKLYFCEDHFDLENDMENYMRYKIMGSVKQIKIKPDCVPSRFECHSEKERKPTSKKRARKKKSKMPVFQDYNYMKNEELKQSVRSSYEIKAFCPKCNTEVAHTAEGIQEDQRKAFIAKVFHYFEQEFEVLKKMNAQLILTNLAKFSYRTAMATGLSETAVLEILQEEVRRNAAKRGMPQNDGKSQELPQNAEKPQEPSEKRSRVHKNRAESSNEEADDKIEDNGQSGVVQNMEVETIIVKAEPLDFYNEEPAMNIEPKHAPPLNEEQVQIDSIITVHVKLETPDEEMNEPHTEDESLTTAASSSYQPTKTLDNIRKETEAEKLPIVNSEPVKNPSVKKSKAQSQREYRLRKKLENRTERKVRKTKAEYHKKYREKQKVKQLSETEDSKLARNKANAERARRYRENKKMKLQSEPLDTIVARKRNNAERTKRYRDKLKSKKIHAELESSQSTNDTTHFTIPTASMESYPETEQLNFSQFQMNQFQSSVDDATQSSLLGERKVKVEKIEFDEEGFS